MTAGLNFSRLEKALHRIAFASWSFQVALADIEDVAFRAELAGIEAARPVFIAGLPRSGSTLLLRLIEATGEFASYRYRDMPFLLTPMLWRRISGASRAVGARERSQGDGLAIDLDSPEAFEEVIWRTFCPRRYRPDRIEAWPREVDPELAGFLARQMRKIIALRREDTPGARRYLSKNNGNIARLPTIARLFPDAVIIVPFRDPLAQAQSLLRQHENFLRMHRADPFARDYMRAIGHHDFGENLRPIDFGGWLDSGAPPDFTRLQSWLDYWCAAYGALAETATEQTWFVSLERLCSTPAPTLAALEQILGVHPPGGMASRAAEVRGASPVAGEAAEEVDVRAAEGVLEKIRARQLV